MYQYNWFPKKGMLMLSLIIIQFPCFTLKIGTVSKKTLLTIMMKGGYCRIMLIWYLG